jgi:hypothetical protein
MSEKADNETEIRRVVLCYEDTHEIFDDLINMSLVYVPTVITNNKIKDDLYIFARFFAVISSEEAARFCDEFKENGLAKELVRLYDEAVFDEAALEVLGSQPYYTEREYLMDKAEWEQEKNTLEQENAKLLEIIRNLKKDHHS